MKRLAIVVACMLVASCGSPEQNFIWAAKDAAKAQLKDPPSARFPIEPYVVRTRGTGESAKYDQVAACGIIDGKNGFGGYSGGTRFVAWTFVEPGAEPDRSVVVNFDDSPRSSSSDGPSPYDEFIWNKYCVDAAHPAATR
ncbi:hypothetical protein [Caulobacter sp. Root655]|uniref:hypothetical protein n=1 Tax=Caulobacter sp. Root655 TaxID=1736578 RepID=UPI0012E3EA73|nr:hypothetical protein [Caulobacter sp. Root655]